MARGDLAETGALEAKSTIDLTKKLGVAKFFLGASNRQPAAAQRYFGGHAVLLLGVAVGEEPGLPGKAIKAHDLANALKLYLGAAEKRWDLHHVPSTATGQDVVGIVIERHDAPQVVNTSRCKPAVAMKRRIMEASR